MGSVARLPNASLESSRVRTGCRRARAAAEAYGPSSLQVVNALRQWGDTERLRSNLDEVERLLRQSTSVLDGMGGPVPAERAHVVNNLGLVLQTRGRFAEAETMFREAVSIVAKFPDQRTEWLTMRSNLGGVLGELGRLEESEQELRDVLVERRRVFGERHPQVVRSLSRLGRAMLRRQDAAEAEPLLREALEKSLAVLGEEHLETLSARALLAAARLQLGDTKEAVELLGQSVRRGEQALGADHLEVLAWKLSLAEALAAGRRIQEANAMGEAALAGLEHKLGPSHPRVARAREVMEKINPSR